MREGKYSTGSTCGAQDLAPPRDFGQDAIDRAAAVAGLTETTAYVQEWHRQVEPLQGEIRSQLKALAASIESSYDNEALEELVRNGGQAKIGKDEVNGLRH